MKLINTLVLSFLAIWSVAQPALVKDINPGSGNSKPARFSNNPFVSVGQKLVFLADDGVHGEEYWISDGSEAGTVLLKDINPGNASPFVSALVLFKGFYYFRANDGQNGAELWRTDGTEEGTILFKDINPGTGSSSPSWFAVMGDRMFFSANDGVTGQELWVTDGTPEGTELFKDIYTEVGRSSRPAKILPYKDGKFFFLANEIGESYGLWICDGTPGGVQELASKVLNYGVTDQNFLVIGDLLFFEARASFMGEELWTSDGTVTGTKLLRNFDPDNVSTRIENMIEYKNQLFFEAKGGIWESDGTEAGTQMVSTIIINANHKVSYKDEIYFAGRTNSWNNDLYKTKNDTIELVKNNGGGFDLDPLYFYVTHDKLYFSGRVLSGFGQVCVTDGTTAGTKQLTNINNDGGAYVSHFHETDSVLYFFANESATGYELWKLPLRPIPLSATIQIRFPVGCFGDLDAGLRVYATGGEAPYQYKWDPPTLQGSDPVGMGAGTYTVTVTDFAGQSTVASVTITQPDRLLANPNSTAETNSQKDGSVSVAPTGGTPPYNYRWNTGGRDSFLTNLSAGIYTVTITDDRDCETIARITVQRVTGAADLEKELGLKIFPTLTKGVIRIEFERPNFKPFDLEIEDYTGRTIMKRTALSGDQQLDISENEQGLYFLILKLDVGWITKKIILTQ